MGAILAGGTLKPLGWRERRWVAEDVRAMRRIRRQIATYLGSVTSVGAACEAEFGRSVTLRVVESGVRDRLPDAPTFLTVPLSLGDADDSRLVVFVPNALALRLAMLSFGKDVRVKPGEQRPLPPAAADAAAEVIARAARRLGVPWSRAALPPIDGDVGLVHVDVRIDGDVFRAMAAVLLARALPPHPLARAALAAHGDLPLWLPVVASIACATDDELAVIDPGMAWVPGGETWTLWQRDNGAWEGEAIVAAPTAEVGLAVRAESRALRVTDLRVSCPWVSSYYDGAHEDPRRVVRVEAGQVRLHACDWAAALTQGALLPLPRGDATLRVGGRAVARGRLTMVEGERAFQIDQAFNASTPSPAR